MKFSKFLPTLLTVAFIVGFIFLALRWMDENRVLRRVIERLSADSRVAEVLVTKTELSEARGRVLTTIKFLEYDTQGKPLEPKYFTFEGNLIQFQALVVRFKDELVKAGDKLRGKSAFLFLKAFLNFLKDVRNSAPMKKGMAVFFKSITTSNRS